MKQDKPLQAALLAAIQQYNEADRASDECDCESAPGEVCEHYLAWKSTLEAVDAAREALRVSDEPRQWRLSECGHEYTTITASSCEEALEEARDGVERDNYSDAEGTLWITVRVRCELTGESDSDTVACDEEEPKCTGADEHDWQAPYEIVGGLKENPGVFGHDGGLLINEVCLHCGLARQTDTWAQNPETGEQGLVSVRYEKNKYAGQLGLES